MKPLHRGLEALAGLGLLLAWLAIAMLADQALLDNTATAAPAPAAAASAVATELGRLS